MPIRRVLLTLLACCACDDPGQDAVEYARFEQVVDWVCTAVENSQCNPFRVIDCRLILASEYDEAERAGCAAEYDAVTRCRARRGLTCSDIGFMSWSLDCGLDALHVQWCLDAAQSPSSESESADAQSP